ncbi:MAG: aminotransferase class V-fold PLP-dependent enzyme [Actinobacteria bacterium]|nr:aminotransferase class V-fold PLP-dependent enzyme [Actinomycetota bacterium]
MTPDEFRTQGKRMIDWIADYMGSVGDYPVLSQVDPGWVQSQLPASAPLQGDPFDDVMEDVERIVMPGITHWQSPNFFAYFPANVSGPSILGDLLSSGLGVQGMIWATSPACTEVETRMLDWLVDMMGLPDSFLSTGRGGGVIQDTASSAALTALIAARERATGLTTNREGATGNLVVYTSTHTHSSLEKAVRVAGIGDAQLRAIEVDENYAMLPDAFEAQIAIDRSAGLIPIMVTGTIGTTSSNAMDPLRTIGEIAAREGIWFHVDAAMSGTAMVCPEFRHLIDGVEYADSYCFNPHKWMFTNFDCSAFFVRDRETLISSLSVLPEYLRNKATESGAVIDYRDWHIPLGRRFRALKLWFVIRHYGIEGLQHHVREHVAWARSFADRVVMHPDFELSAPLPLNLVCFRHTAGDAMNQHILDSVNGSGEMYLTHTKLDGNTVLRMSIGGTNTTELAVNQAWDRIVAVTDHAAV